jgi:hypothetical protein
MVMVSSTPLPKAWILRPKILLRQTSTEGVIVGIRCKFCSDALRPYVEKFIVPVANLSKWQSTKIAKGWVVVDGKKFYGDDGEVDDNLMIVAAWNGKDCGYDGLSQFCCPACRLSAQKKEERKR